MPTSGRNNSHLKFKNWFKSFPSVPTKGFTLIELLVVTALIGILSAVVLANYNSFGVRQGVRNTAEEFKSELRKYQTFATAGHKNPIQNGACSNPINVLEYYQVEIDVLAAPAEYETTVVCTGAGITLPAKKFPQKITVTSSECNPLIIRFFPLNQGAVICPGSIPPVSTADLTFSQSGTDYIVTMTDAGEVQVHK